MPPWPPAKGSSVPRRSAGVAAVLGWLVPGLGQVYVGRPVKGLLYFVVLGGTYLAGLWLTGWTCVNPERDPYWFVGQALAGGPTALTAWLTQGLEATERMPTYDVGLLYVTVAALLNAVAVSDALGTVSEYRAARAVADAAERQEEIDRMAREAAYLPPAVAVAGLEAGGVVDVDVPPPLPPLSSLSDDGTAQGPGEVVP